MTSQKRTEVPIMVKICQQQNMRVSQRLWPIPRHRRSNPFRRLFCSIKKRGLAKILINIKGSGGTSPSTLCRRTVNEILGMSHREFQLPVIIKLLCLTMVTIMAKRLLWHPRRTVTRVFSVPTARWCLHWVSQIGHVAPLSTLMVTTSIISKPIIKWWCNHGSCSPREWFLRQKGSNLAVILPKKIRGLTLMITSTRLPIRMTFLSAMTGTIGLLRRTNRLHHRRSTSLPHSRLLRPKGVQLGRQIKLMLRWEYHPVTRVISPRKWSHCKYRKMNYLQVSFWNMSKTLCKICAHRPALWMLQTMRRGRKPRSCPLGIAWRKWTEIFGPKLRKTTSSNREEGVVPREAAHRQTII